MVDPYRVLGVTRQASAEDIKKAYRKLAKRLHPDVNPGNKKIETQFKEASAAYDLLSDPEKRAKFDRGEIDDQGNPRHGPGGFNAGGFGGGFRPGARGRRGGAGGEDEGFAEDIFKDFFNFGGKRTGLKMRGADVTYKLEVDFLDAALGAKRRVNLADGKTLDIAIPPATEDGQQLRLKGQGMTGHGGAPDGDAFIEIAVKKHAYFERQGFDILLECPIALDEAVLGAAISVPTIHGTVTLKVPKGSNSGTQLRLKGKGIENAKAKTYGDQYVRFVVTLPRPIDSDLESAIERWAKHHPYTVRGKFGEG
jgi:DnaJ-class molecular chaperone